MAELPAEQSKRGFEERYWFGLFKIKTSQILTTPDAKVLATVFGFTPVDIENIVKDDNPGLALLTKLEQKGKISKTNIDELVVAMENVGMKAQATTTKDCFSNRPRVEESEAQDQAAAAVQDTDEETAEMYPYLTQDESEDIRNEGKETLKKRVSENKKRYEKRISKYSLKNDLFLKVSDDNKTDINMAIFGNTGSGKSSTANTILGRDDFRTSQSGNSTTKVSCDATCFFRNRRITVVDTPGFQDNTQSKSAIERQLKRWAFLLRRGIDCFIICMNATNARFTQDIREMINVVKRTGDANFYNYVMVVYTNAEGALKKSSLDDFLVSAKENIEYKTFLDAIKDRVVAIDNTTELPIEFERNREAIIAMADKTCKENESSVYTNKVITKADKLHEDIEKAVKLNHCHPILVNAVVEGIISVSIFDLSDVDKFKESVISSLMQRDTVEKISNGPYVFNYEGKKTELFRYELEKQIKIIFRDCYNSLGLFKRAVLEFLQLYRQCNKFLTEKTHEFCHQGKSLLP